MGDRDGHGFIQVSELAAYVQDRVPGQQRVTNGCRTHQNLRLIWVCSTSLNRKCAAWRPQHPYRSPVPSSRQTAPNTRIARCQVLRESRISLV